MVSKLQVFIDSSIVLSMFMMSIHLCDSMWCFWSGSESVHVFHRLFIHVLPLEIQLSRGKGWDPINQFNLSTSLCLSKARTWISNVISQGIFYVQ